MMTASSPSVGDGAAFFAHPDPLAGSAMPYSHDDYMNIALSEAILADREDEVPIGAVLVDAKGNILSQGHNQTLSRCDPSAHAEMNVIRAAARQMGNYRLLRTTLYVTVEPCLMCMGAVVHARIQTLVYGAPDPKWGAAGSLYDLGRDSRLNHQVDIISGILEAPCRSVIQTFFRRRRTARLLR
ncbi:tRNA adenosine(34) deaminase TadA [Desulfosarcina sp. OttesenSCG-928-G10]|nr:tRNA adenosine(34) deaminase TadA [Desulfosarcina sp. OttesenSCG-928-G10]MDL2321456.1 tRNA adenosine(34) deaminase TadA [Desulfosarcina sp. OttesenSCG-928-B08]